VRKRALACLLTWLLAGTCAAVYGQQSPPPQGAQQTPQAPQGKPSEAKQAVSEKPAEKRSTPEDRQRLVTVAHKLEATPLDPALVQEREWAVSWVVAAPDVHARICPSLLADLRRPRYKYRSEIAAQLLISSAVFLIEHPDQADNNTAQNIGGMQSVLKAYSAIIKTEPQANAKSLDALLEKQSQGKLPEAVREIVKDCH
jgi:hypothetical protein